MKTFKLYSLLFEVLVLLASSSVAVNQLQFNNGNFNVSWNYLSASQEIEFEIRAKTTGYVALGLTKVNSGMKGLDIALVGVNSGVKTIKDLNANSESSPLEDSQNYTLISASESNGITMARYKRKLLTNDDDDLQIKPGEKVYIAWATKPGSDALSYHGSSNRGYSSEMQELVPIEVNPTTGSSSNGTVAPETTATSEPSKVPTTASATISTGSALFFVLAVFAALLAP